MKTLSRWVVAAAWLAFVGCAHQNFVAGERPGSETLPFVGTFKVHRDRLDNGLRVLIVEDHSSPTLAYQTWFNVGSRDEQVGYTGLAHLFEHMMFKGTSNHKEGEFDRILESNGAEGENASTNRDYTDYVQEMPKEKLELIMQLESDRMVNLVVDENSFKTEREVVQNERRYRNENSPEGMMYQEIFGLAFNKHSYRWPVIGYEEDLNRMSGKEALEFYKAHYVPNNAAIVIVGDVNPEETFALVKKYYGSLAARPVVNGAIEPEPEQKESRRKVLKLGLQVEKLMMGYRTPAVTHEDLPALTLLRAVLAGGKSSRLERALVDTGIATSIEAYDIDEKDPSLMLFAASMQKGRKAGQAENVILREIARLMQEKVTDKELARARNTLAMEFYDAVDDSMGKARVIGQYEVVAGDFQVATRIFEKAMKVSAEQVRDAAKKYLQNNNRTVIVGVPR